MKKGGWQAGDRDMVVVCKCGIAHWFPDWEETEKFMKTSVEKDEPCVFCGSRSLYATECFGLNEGHLLYRKLGVAAYSEACETGRKRDSLTDNLVERALCVKREAN
jgi:hypothetical protein